MGWASIVALLLQRAEAGFPLLKKLLNRETKEEILAAAASITDSQTLIGAAPADVKTAIVEVLKQLTGSVTSLRGKAVLHLLLAVVPMLADAAWDKLITPADGGPALVVGAVGTDGIAEAFAEATAV